MNENDAYRQAYVATEAVINGAADTQVVRVGSVQLTLSRARPPCAPMCCWRCDPDYPGMLLCSTCGNKRCPRASDHTLACTQSNEPGQSGSIYTQPPRAN